MGASGIATASDLIQVITSPAVSNEPLSLLAVEIAKAHEQATTAAQSSLEAARRAGELLREVKSRLPHGEWLRWLRQHCPHISPRVAQNYMGIACRWTELMANTKRDSYLPLREALRLLQTPGSVEWYSPGALVEAAREVLGGIDLDPASSPIANETVRATRYFTIDDDGLQRDWPGRVWLNPPYAGQAGAFVRHLFDQFDRHITTAAVLLISAVPTGSSWFQPLLREWPICFVGRVHYVNPEGVKKPSMNASAVVYIGPEPERFARVYKRFGPVLRQWSPDEEGVPSTAVPSVSFGDNAIPAATSIDSLAVRVTTAP